MKSHSKLFSQGLHFESQTQVYNALHGKEDEKKLISFANSFGRVHNEESLTWKLNEKRLEDGWFLYQLTLFYKSVGSLPTTDLGTEVTGGNGRHRGTV